MEKTEERVRVRLEIEGRVQGVFFRASTLEQATRLGVNGWVRNCPGGSVEVVAEGKRKSLDSLVAWSRHGPRGAHVHDVQIRWEDFKNEFQDFHIRG